MFKCTAHTCTQPPGSWKRGALCKHVCREPGAGNPKVLGNFLHSLCAPISRSPGNRGRRTGETVVISTGDFLPRVSDIHHPSLQINSVAPPCRRSNRSPHQCFCDLSKRNLSMYHSVSSSPDKQILERNYWKPRASKQSLCFQENISTGR